VCRSAGLQHRTHHLANDILECLGAGLLAPLLLKCGKLRAIVPLAGTFEED
jgi:hypothetical protein